MEQRVCRLGELSEGKPRVFHVNGTKIAVMKTGTGVVAFSPFCPHARANLLHGRYDGLTVTCHWHGWKFDLKTGKGTNNDAGLTTYPVRVDEDNVFVQLKGDVEPVEADEAFFMPEIRWKNEKD